jgi:predicted phosphodiesterase
MPLPKLGTKDWEAEVKAYQRSDHEWRENRARELGYSCADSYINQINRRGVKLLRPEVAGPATQELPQINLPPVVLKQYVPINSGRTGDPETMVLHLTDWHFGQVTRSFDEDVFDQRLDHLFQSVVKIAKLHRNMYPINDLEILITGDMIHGENPHQGAKVGAVDKGARDQIIGLLPKISGFILSLQQEFKTVNIHCVRGNHGRYDRIAPATSNWDMMLYDQLKIKLEPYKIPVEVSNDFYLIVEIQGKKFFIFHGDQYKATQGIPFFALTKGLQSWYVTYGGFDYAVCGHFHTDHFIRLNAKSKLIMGASIVTDDTFTQEVVKSSSIPSQWVWGVHKQKGVTWSYPLIVDDKYF